MLHFLVVLICAQWRRLDGSNKKDRWNISKGAWRSLLFLVLTTACYLKWGEWGILTGVVTSISLFMGFETLTYGKGWTSWWMWWRYACFVFPATCMIGGVNPYYYSACILAGLSYPIGAKYFSQYKYTEWCERIVGAVVLGGLSFI